MNMKIHPEILEIAKLETTVRQLEEQVVDQIDVEGLNWHEADILENCQELNGGLYQDGRRLDNSGVVDDTYYCRQYTGHCEDDFYGHLYFKTDIEGRFVTVPFFLY